MRTLAKQVALGLATLAVAPTLLSFWIRGQLFGRDRALEGSTQALSLVPGVIGQYLRRAFLMQALDHCDASATVEFGTIFSTCAARLEAGVYVGPRCHLGYVHLERDVLVAAGVHIPSGGRIHGDSETEGAFKDQPLVRTCVRIGAGAWLGSASVVMADVGAGTIVAAGAVVTRPLPSRVVAGGVPARVIRERDAHDQQG
jgi:virginiamycin A acetyltransferase